MRKIKKESGQTKSSGYGTTTQTFILKLKQNIYFQKSCMNATLTIYQLSSLSQENFSDHKYAKKLEEKISDTLSSSASPSSMLP